MVKGKKKDLKNFNPLSKSKSNPWNNFFADSEIRDQIKVDIERTFQDKKVFENSRLKNILSTILYVWAKMNPEFNYRQGMNDLLGIIAYNCIRETPNRTFEPKTKYLFFLNHLTLLESKSSMHFFLTKNTGKLIFTLCSIS